MSGLLHPDISFANDQVSASTLKPLAALSPNTADKIHSARVTRLPAVIQSNHFDTGGEGVSYFDSTDEKFGDKKFRPNTSVDIQDRNGRVNVGWFTPGEWLEYSFYVEEVAAVKVRGFILDFILLIKDKRVTFLL